MILDKLKKIISKIEPVSFIFILILLFGTNIAQWLLCYPRLLFLSKDFMDADLQAVTLYINEHDHHEDLEEFEDNKNIITLKTQNDLNKNSFGYLSGTGYNTKDIKIYCNKQEAVDYDFSANIRESSVFNQPYFLIYDYHAKVFLYPGINRITIKTGKKTHKYYVKVIKQNPALSEEMEKAFNANKS